MIWQRKHTAEDRELSKALVESQRNRDEIEAKEKEMEPSLARVEAALERNHIQATIVSTFRVVR